MLELDMNAIMKYEITKQLRERNKDYVFELKELDEKFFEGCSGFIYNPNTNIYIFIEALCKIIDDESFGNIFTVNITANNRCCQGGYVYSRNNFKRFINFIEKILERKYTHIDYDDQIDLAKRRYERIQYQINKEKRLKEEKERLDKLEKEAEKNLKKFKLILIEKEKKKKKKILNEHIEKIKRLRELNPDLHLKLELVKEENGKGEYFIYKFERK